MLQNYDWIADEKKYFGQPNTGYDFKVNDPKESERRIQKLTETKDKLAKSVNMRAMNMLGKAEEQVSRMGVENESFPHFSLKMNHFPTFH